MINENLTDNVRVVASYTAKKERLEDALLKALPEALLNQTGLKPAEVNYADDRLYKVELRGLKNGKPAQDLKYTGQSSKGIEDAIKDAIKDKVVDYDPVIAGSVEQTAKAPYFIVPVVSRSLDQKKLENYNVSAVGQLEDTYARRLNRTTPVSVEYKVIYLATGYTKDENLPKGDITNSLTQGKSNVSMDDAITKGGNKPKKTEVTIYEQTVMMMVYGQKEASMATDKRSSATSPPPATSSQRSPSSGSRDSGRSYPRGGSPAAISPAALESPNKLM